MLLETGLHGQTRLKAAHPTPPSIMFLDMRKDDGAAFKLPPRRAEIHLNPSKAAFLCQLAHTSVSLCNNISFVHFIRLDVGFWEARPACSAQRELKYNTAATQSNGWVTDFTSRSLLE